MADSNISPCERRYMLLLSTILGTWSTTGFILFLCEIYNGPTMIGDLFRVGGGVIVACFLVFLLGSACATGWLYGLWCDCLEDMRLNCRAQREEVKGPEALAGDGTPEQQRVAAVAEPRVQNPARPVTPPPPQDTASSAILTSNFSMCRAAISPAEEGGPPSQPPPPPSSPPCLLQESSLLPLERSTPPFSACSGITQRTPFSRSSPPPAPSPSPSPADVSVPHPVIPTNSSADISPPSARTCGLFFTPRCTLRLFQNGESPAVLHTVLLLPCNHICELLVVFWDEVWSWTCPICGEEVREVLRQAED